MTLLTRWDPLRDLATMQNRINRFVRESYRPEDPEEALTTTTFAPPVDIYEDEHTIAVKMEVPGIDEKDTAVKEGDGRRLSCLPFASHPREWEKS